MRLLLLFSGFFPLLCSPLSAALIPGQISKALGAPEAVSWSVAGPDANAWSMGGEPGLILTAGANTVHTLSATVTGPGVLELRSSFATGFFTGAILVDGLVSGRPLTGFIPDKVQVGAGSHTVSWRMTAPLYAPATKAVFSSAEWFPITESSLQSAAAKAGVTLSGPWIGQNQWHDGDGAAAWSGLLLSESQSNPVTPNALRAHFSGAGVLKYRARARNSNGYFRLDGASWNIQQGDGRWTTRVLPVEEGTHIAEWAPSPSGAYGRQDADLTVDDIEFVPAVPLATALDTPGREWGITTQPWQQTFGYPLRDTVGGSVVALHGYVFTDVAAGDRVTFSVTGVVNVEMTGHSHKVVVSQGEPAGEGTWTTYTFQSPATGLLSISSDTPVLLDHVRITPSPADLSVALGLPAGSVTTGGEGRWNLFPVEGQTADAVQTVLVSGSPEAWLEFPVTGPAEVSMGFGISNYPGRALFSVDGVTVWDSKISGYQDRFKIQVPAGSHVIRLLARHDVPYNPAVRLTALPVTISSVPSAGDLSAALDMDGVWAMRGDWENSPYLTHDGVDAAQLAPTSTGTGRLRMPITGPGVLSFRTFAGIEGHSSGQLAVTSSVGTNIIVYGYEEEGWEEHTIIYPPGGHWVEWQIDEAVPEHPLIAIDSVSFTSSPVIPLGEALGAPELVWGNDTALPWTGVDRDGGVAVSPVFANSGSSRFSTTVQGPGVLAFHWKAFGATTRCEVRVNGASAGLVYDPWNQTEVRMILIEEEGPCVIEWEASPVYAGGWMEVRDVFWRPWLASGLGAALESPEGVAWTTSPELPFEGRPNPHAKGGTSAQIILKPGEESWLEATVDGPGRFDFWLREAPGGSVIGPLPRNLWDLYVDGVKVALNGGSWPAQWIQGAGAHQIRLVFRCPESEWGTRAVAVDDVSWRPLAPAVTDAGWRASEAGHVRAYQDGGKDGAAQVVLRAHRGDTDYWAERTITGPALVEWNSLATTSGLSYARGFAISVNGVGAATAGDFRLISSEGEWERHRLSLPAGEHIVRWSQKTLDGMVDPAWDLSSSWQICGLTVTPGITPFQQAVEDATMAWLEIGEGTAITGAAAHDQTDAWHFPKGGWSLLYNVTGQGARATGVRRDLVDAAWKPRSEWVSAGTTVLWENTMPYGFAHERWESVSDAFSATLIPSTTLAAALDTPGEITSGKWLGISYVPEAHDGEDVAWSGIPGLKTDTQILPMTITGPARVRFHWRHTGGGGLTCRIDGRIVPLPASGAVWSEREIMVDEGVHEVSWVNEMTDDTEVRSSDAWIDQVSVSPQPAASVEAAAMDEQVLSLRTTESAPLDQQWKPAFYLDATDTWREGIRCVSGSSTLSATVTGPAILTFRGRCVPAIPAGYTLPGGSGAALAVGGGDSRERSVIVIIGNPGTGSESSGSTRWFLSVGVDGKESTRIGSGGWNESSVLIPAGTHEVTWRVMAAYNGGSSSSPYYAYVPAYLSKEGWVDDLRIQTTRGHFDAWADHHQLTAGLRAPEHDADGDGVDNLTEYALGSDPASAASRPPALASTFQRTYVRDGWSGITSEHGRTVHLQVPYLSAFAAGEIQKSSDLVTWTPVSQAIPDALELWPVVTLPPLVVGRYTYTSVPETRPVSNVSHHAVAIPVPIADTSGFYRMKITLPE